MHDLLSTNTLLQILCYPWLELRSELNALFIENKHPVRSAIRIFGIILATCVGLYIVFNNPYILEFFTGIIRSLEFVPTALQTKAAWVLSVLASSSFGAYTSKALIRSFCKCKFGDPDFFLTSQRKAELVQIFRSQELEIQEELIQHVVDFCIHNLRESHQSSEIGTTPKDWERILNSLIYDADLDLFLDQQAALQTKHQRILEKQAAINAYTNLNASLARTITPNNPTLLFTQPSNTVIPIAENYDTTQLAPPTIIETAPTLPIQSEHEIATVLPSKRVSIDSGLSRSSSDSKHSEHTPSSFNATRSFGKISDNSTASIEETTAKAQQTLAQFKHVHCKKHRVRYSLPEEQLVNQCSRHLANKAYCTHKCILNTPGVDALAKQLQSANYYQI